MRRTEAMLAGFYIPWVPRPWLMKRMGRWHVRLFRATRGLVGRRADGLDMLLLTTRGRRSGALRTTPLPYFRDAGRLVVVASSGGSDRDPAWLRNLDAEPAVSVELGASPVAAHARRARPAERARLWATITHAHPRYRAYQQKTSREIPLVVLEPSRPDAAPAFGATR